MKIGAFAKKHNVSMHTIRHYIDMQLLLAEKIDAQYNFSQEDSRDMEEIIELKRLNFSLEEIQAIFAYKRLDGRSTTGFKDRFQLFLENKRQELLKQQQATERTMSYVEDKLKELKEEGSGKALGLPISMLNSLRCPYCKSIMSLSEGKIENNMIVSGNFLCSCNYKLDIENGIVIDRNIVRERNNPTKDEYYEKTPSVFINFIFKSIETLIKQFQAAALQPKTILELSQCSGFFFTKFQSYIAKDTVYILVDYDYKRIKALKKNLELNSEHSNFIFLCCDSDKLPLADNSIDLVVDSFTVKEHGRKRGNLFKQHILPLMKSGGYIGGIYPFFSALKNEPSGLTEEEISYFNKTKLTNMFKVPEIEDKYLRERGPAEEGGVYDAYVKGNGYCHLLYMGRKKEA